MFAGLKINSSNTLDKFTRKRNIYTHNQKTNIHVYTQLKKHMLKVNNTNTRKGVKIVQS